jgi:hypothetical protein
MFQFVRHRRRAAQRNVGLEREFMRKIVPVAIALTIAGMCCVFTGYFCHFYSARYQRIVSALDYDMNRFEMRLGTLEAHKSRELTPIRIWGLISTSDRPKDSLGRFSLSEYHPDDYFEAINAKGGPFIRPELRLRTGSTTNCEYDIQVASQFGVVADAWLSHAEPYGDLAAFDQFRVYSPNKTNIVRLIARPRSGASVQMRFEIVVLCEK